MYMCACVNLKPKLCAVSVPFHRPGPVPGHSSVVWLPLHCVVAVATGPASPASQLGNGTVQQTDWLKPASLSLLSQSPMMSLECGRDHS